MGGTKRNSSASRNLIILMLFMCPTTVCSQWKKKVVQQEIELPPIDGTGVNKVLWVCAALIFGCCGLDRCLMGQVCCGCVKCLTLGGLGLWVTVDYIACV